MYGTIATLKLKREGLEALDSFLPRGEKPAGYLASYVYRMDADPKVLRLVVLFESKESYFANAERPESHAEYLAIREHLVEEPEWHDGEVVFADS